MKLGVHLSIIGGLDKSVDRALELGCDTFQIFTRNPRSWKITTLKDDTVEKFRSKLKKSGIWPIYSHMPYIQNLATPNEEIYRKSIHSLSVEYSRCEILMIPYIVTHLGSHLGTGIDNGIDRIVNALSSVLQKQNSDIMILLENSGGGKNQIGSNLQEIKSIIDKIGDQRIGVCFDTCHAFVSGYDIKTKRGIKKVLDEIDEDFGLYQIKLVHLNDSKGTLASGRDHHQHIGLGEIGEEGIKNTLMSRLNKIPMVMETPIDEFRDDLGNMMKVRELASYLNCKM